jgi:hypothetical protein
VTAPDPRRTLEYYADLMDVYGIDAVDMDRWIESHQRPVPVVPGALYVRPPVAGRTPDRRRRQWRLIWPALFAAAAAAALVIAGYVVFRFPPDAPAPCHPGACQVVTPSTIPPTPR